MDKYGLIGYPLGHSFSISYFNEKFANENIDAKYINLCLARSAGETSRTNRAQRDNSIQGEGDRVP